MNYRVCLPGIFLVFLISQGAMAKDLSGHFGIGFNQPLTTTPPAVDVKFALSEAMAIGGGLALDTRDSNNKVAIGGKFYRNAFSEENAHFYIGVSLYFLSLQTAGNSDSGILLGGFIGNEFFFQGLPRLGFCFEAGVALETAGSVRFRTDAASFVTAGIHYYF